MNKKFITFMTIVGMTGGGAAPMLWGDNSLLDGWSILTSMVGGIIGIWLGVKLSKRFG